MDLLLMPSSSVARFAWVSRMAATKIIPGDFPLKDDTLLQPLHQKIFEVMILEISDRENKQLGFSLSTADNSIKYNLLEGSPFSLTLNAGFLVDPKLTATLNALVQEGSAKLLANPRLITLNGNEASFNVLTTSRYWVPQADGTGGENNKDQRGFNQAFRTIETGIRLRLKPWVAASGEITIELHPEISDSAGSSMGSSPSIN